MDAKLIKNQLEEDRQLFRTVADELRLYVIKNDKRQADMENDVKALMVKQEAVYCQAVVAETLKQLVDAIKSFKNQ